MLTIRNSPKKSARKAPRKTARKTVRKSPKKSARKSAKKSPRKSPMKSCGARRERNPASNRCRKVCERRSTKTKRCLKPKKH